MSIKRFDRSKYGLPPEPPPPHEPIDVEAVLKTKVPLSIGHRILCICAGAVVALTLAFVIFRGQLVDAEDAVEAAKTMGFADPEIVDEHRLSPRMCGSDAAAFEMEALNSRNQPVEIVVCCGWPSKACTVRVK